MFYIYFLGAWTIRAAIMGVGDFLFENSKLGGELPQGFALSFMDLMLLNCYITKKNKETACGEGGLLTGPLGLVLVFCRFLLSGVPWCVVMKQMHIFLYRQCFLPADMRMIFSKRLLNRFNRWNCFSHWVFVGVVSGSILACQHRHIVWWLQKFSKACPSICIVTHGEISSNST